MKNHIALRAFTYWQKSICHPYNVLTHFIPIPKLGKLFFTTLFIVLKIVAGSAHENKKLVDSLIAELPQIQDDSI